KNTSMAGINAYAKARAFGDLRIGHEPLESCYTACLMQQFLYFFPLPHGHGSFRPTLAPRLRMGSAFLPLDWWPALAFSCSLSGMGIALGAASLMVAPMVQSVSRNSSPSSMRKTASVTLSLTPSHMSSYSFMPSRL